MVLNHRTSRGGARRGNVALLVAVTLIPLVGMVGIAIDGGVILSEKRKAQATADAAAMAAACIIFQDYQSLTSGGTYNLNSSSNTAARTEARRVAQANGYANDGNFTAKAANTSIVNVNFPNGSGGGFSQFSIYESTTQSPSYEGKLGDGCVEVIVTYFQPRYFSSIWGTDTLPVQARAVAKGAWQSPNDGVIVLDYSGTSMRDTGNGSTTVIGGDFVVNSNSASAAVDSGSGTITAQAFDITGGVSYNGSSAQFTTSPTPDQVFTGVHPSPDPLAYLTAPTMPSNTTPQPAGYTTTDLGMGNTAYVLPPGRYTSLPVFHAGDTVTMTGISAGGGGVYWFDTTFNATGALITSTSGVLIYQNTGTFSISGNSSGSITLNPTTTGPYAGVTFWQPIGNSTNINISGDTNGMFIGGTFYAPSALLTVTGNGTAATGNQFAGQYVTKDFKVAGNGNITINYSGPNAGNTRILTLVE